MNRANRIIYDQTGKILLQTGEATGDILEHDEITELHCIDVPYGSIDYAKNRITGINIETKQPILEEIPVYMSEEEKRIQELENQILLNENEKVGGLL
ncbi:putative phage protein [Clostridioides difficile CD160]|nr:putative phage protein [Clostridioides difficile CD160]